MESKRYDTYPFNLSDKETNYLNTLSEKVRDTDLRAYDCFLELADDLDIKIDLNNPLEFQFGEADALNFEINKILHKHLGFDERIAEDFFFRRLSSVKTYHFDDYNNHRISETNPFYNTVDPFTKLCIDFWGKFSLDRLTQDVFVDLSRFVDLQSIVSISIAVKSITGSIDPNFLMHTPNVHTFQLNTETPLDLPSDLFEYFPAFKSISLFR